MTKRGVSDVVYSDSATASKHALSVVKKERWAPVRGYEDLYIVSDEGRVMRIGRSKGTYPGKVLKPLLKGDGYPTVRIRKRWISVHRMVLGVFVGPCPKGKEANHIDGNKLNNMVGNLEYVTSSENKLHAYRLGLMPIRRGSSAPNAKLTENDVRAIRWRLATGEIQRTIAVAFGVSRSTIRSIKLGERWGWLDAD